MRRHRYIPYAYFPGQNLDTLKERIKNHFGVTAFHMLNNIYNVSTENICVEKAFYFCKTVQELDDMLTIISSTVDVDIREARGALQKLHTDSIVKCLITIEQIITEIAGQTQINTESLESLRNSINKKLNRETLNILKDMNSITSFSNNYNESLRIVLVYLLKNRYAWTMFSLANVCKHYQQIVIRVCDIWWKRRVDPYNLIMPCAGFIMRDIRKSINEYNKLTVWIIKYDKEAARVYHMYYMIGDKMHD